MLLQLTAEHDSLREVTREFLARRLPEPDLRSAMATESGFDEATWHALGTDLGLCGVAIPEEYGGAGGSLIDLAIVMHEFGRALAPLPYLSSAVLTPHVLLATDDRAACRRLLPGIASGQLRAAVALVEPGWRWDPTAVSTTAIPDGETWRLSGTKTFVIDGATADVILLAANTAAGITLFEVEAGSAGLARRVLSGIDQTRKLATVGLVDTPARQIGAAGTAGAAIGQALVVANVCLSAESVGGAEYVLETSVGYAKLREQFGRLIGSFQAIKHKCADMFVEVESARATVQSAVAAVNSRSEDFPSQANIAAALCHEAFVRCARENIQIHGGIGFTWEHPAHLYFKRAQANRLLFGDGVHHRRSLADALGI